MVACITAARKNPRHDHPSTPTVYVYATDGGRLEPARRKRRAGDPSGGEGRASRFSITARSSIIGGGARWRGERVLRLELKTEPIDLPEKDVRRAPTDGCDAVRKPQKSRILRVLPARRILRVPRVGTSRKPGGDRNGQKIPVARCECQADLQLIVSPARASTSRV